jgi:hypothetical protein
MLGMYTSLGKVAPPVQATQWFNAGPAGNTRPIAGKPALLVFASHACGSMCYTPYGVLRRLATKYAAQGLDVTLITRTAGFYKGELIRPDMELIKIKEYFLDRLELPVTIAAWKTDLGRGDDGRVTVQSAPNDEAYKPTGGVVPAFLVDKSGKIRLLMDLSREHEAIFESVIQSML